MPLAPWLPGLSPVCSASGQASGGRLSSTLAFLSGHWVVYQGSFQRRRGRWGREAATCQEPPLGFRISDRTPQASDAQICLGHLSASSRAALPHPPNQPRALLGRALSAPTVLCLFLRRRVYLVTPLPFVCEPLGVAMGSPMVCSLCSPGRAQETLGERERTGLWVRVTSPLWVPGELQAPSDRVW